MVLAKVENGVNIKMTKNDVEQYIYERKANNYINSIHTERSYRTKINAWLKFCAGDESVGNAQKYRDSLALKYDSSILVRPTLYILGNFYDSMKTDNPFCDIIKNYRVKKSDVATKAIERSEKSLSYEEIQKMICVSRGLIEKSSKASKIFIAQRNYLLLMMLYRFGMRINSLVNIKMSHIDFEKNKIIIYKSKTVAYPIPISPIKTELRSFINQRSQYLSQRRFKTFKPEAHAEYLLTTQSGIKLSDLVARNAINMIARRANVYKKGRSTHQLRHFRATRNYKNGMSMDLISRIMGVSVETLKAVYLHVNTDDIIDQYERWAKTKKGFVCPKCGYSKHDHKEKEKKFSGLKVIK